MNNTNRPHWFQSTDGFQSQNTQNQPRNSQTGSINHHWDNLNQMGNGQRTDSYQSLQGLPSNQYCSEQEYRKHNSNSGGRITEDSFGFKTKKIKLISNQQYQEPTQYFPQRNQEFSSPTSFIYQVIDQQWNNVDKQIKYNLLHHNIMPEQFFKANQNNIQIIANPNLCQFQIISNNSIQNLQQYFNRFCMDLNQWTIVFQKCNSKQNADALAWMLNQNEMITRLKNTFQNENLIVNSTTKLDQYFSSQNMILEEKWKNTLFALSYSFQDQAQFQFKQFIESPQNFQQLIFYKKYELNNFDLSCEPNIDKIKTQIENLDRQGIEVYISHPIIDKQINLYVCQVQFIMWHSVSMEKNQLDSRQKQIQDQIQDIVNPQLFMLLEKDQKDIWDNYLKYQYQTQQNGIKIVTLSNPESNIMQIRLKGDVDKCQDLLKIIVMELNSIKIQELDIIYIQMAEQEQFEGNNSILNILEVQQFKSLIFKKQLDEIQRSFKNLRIYVNKILNELSTIQFKIYYIDNIPIVQIQQILIEKLITKIQVFTKKINFQRFLEYTKLDILTLQENYGMLVSENDDSMTFVSTKQYVEEFQGLIKEFQQHKTKSFTLQLESSLIIQKLKELIDSKQFKILEGVTFNVVGNIIQLDGCEEQVSDFSEMIISKQQQLKQQLIQKKLNLSKPEVIFFIDKIYPFMLNQLGYEIKVNQTSSIECEMNKNSVKLSRVSTLTYEGRELSIVQTDFAEIKCEAIVNFCDSLMSHWNIYEEQSKIFEMGGLGYNKFCKDYIQKYKYLVPGKAIVYYRPILTNGVQNYIINVSMNGQQKNQDLKIIKQNIEAIFIEANTRKIKTFSLPKFGENQYFLNQIINNLYSNQNKTVKKVYVRELSEQKFIEISQVLKQVFEPPQQIRQVKYQWQWEKEDEFLNYDSDQNRQIDEEYEKFQNQIEPHEFKLLFPIFKKPGTHLVNLEKQTITDKDVKKNIIQLSQRRNGRFLFDNQEIDDVTNEYLQLQKKNKNSEFEIFYKKHKIIFRSAKSIEQINEATGFSRKVKFQAVQNILIGENVKLKLNKQAETFSIPPEPEIVIQSFDLKVIENLQQQFEAQIKAQQVDLTIQLPPINDEDFELIKMFILNSSIKVDREIINGQSMILKIFKENQQMIQAEINKVTIKSMKYPINWEPQDSHFLGVDLPSNSEEYEEIKREFKKTDKGKIHKIYRLQNQEIWQNYQYEQQKLQNIRKKEGNTPLTSIETERYLWHGVRGSHPEIIYESMKEAFDITYSNEGMWGTGIYFAERADYSRDYSYELKKKDDPVHTGKLVLLCCKVATGRVQKTKPNNKIQRPQEGYDCVSGFTNNGCSISKGSDVFILYGMDVRRAYPAYEIIYE